MPALRSRVKENRVRVPGDPVTVNGEQPCGIPLCSKHEKVQGSEEP